MTFLGPSSIAGLTNIISSIISSHCADNQSYVFHNISVTWADQLPRVCGCFLKEYLSELRETEGVLGITLIPG